jgi:hypothetical protein
MHSWTPELVQGLKQFCILSAPAHTQMSLHLRHSLRDGEASLVLANERPGVSDRDRSANAAWELPVDI